VPERLIPEDLDLKFSGAPVCALSTGDLEHLLLRANQRQHPMAGAIRKELRRRSHERWRRLMKRIGRSRVA
jgi:hypothetical protein